MTDPAGQSVSRPPPRPSVAALGIMARRAARHPLRHAPRSRAGLAALAGRNPSRRAQALLKPLESQTP